MVKKKRKLDEDKLYEILLFCKKYFFQLFTIIKNENIKCCSSTKVGHIVTSCYQTNLLFQNIFTCDDELDARNDLIVTQIVLKGGNNFPDHQLIYIEYMGNQQLP